MPRRPSIWPPYSIATSVRAAKRPTGSGAVESAIRRILNLRIKAPGSFWTPEAAETMIFLRSKLLYHRWDAFRSNYLRHRRQPLSQHTEAMPQD